MAEPKPRLFWIDNLRTAMIALVVTMHACVTYSHVGDWYFMSAHEPTLTEKIPFILFQGHLQAFFMGLLFFLAGYFAQRSLARRGPGAFLRERLFRLGLPTLFFIFVIHPFVLLGLNPWHNDYPPVLEAYRKFIVSGRFLHATGPLWFAFALLIFCTALAGWRKIFPSTGSQPRSAPSAEKLFTFGLLLALTTFLVHLIQPVGTNVFNLQLCYFPQYIAVFIAGLAAARHDWLVDLAHSAHARKAGWLALIGGPIALLLIMYFGGPNPVPYFGGLHWQAFAEATWEQLAGLGLGLGCLALFSRRFNQETPWSRWLSDRAFGVYVLHTPVLVALTMAFASLTFNPYIMALLLTLGGLIGSFIFADLARRIPGLRAIL